MFGDFSEKYLQISQDLLDIYDGDLEEIIYINGLTLDEVLAILVEKGLIDVDLVRGAVSDA